MLPLYRLVPPRITVRAGKKDKKSEFVFVRLLFPPTDGGGLTISGNLKSFEGPVLKCRGSTERRALYLNELDYSGVCEYFVFLPIQGVCEYFVFLPTTLYDL
jgi:hypothetical protein